MRLHIYKIEEDRTADCSEIFVYGAFSAAEAQDNADFIWRYLTASERKRASIYAQGFDLDTALIPASQLEELELERNFDPRDLSDEKLSMLLATLDESIMQPPFDIPVDISHD